MIPPCHRQGEEVKSYGGNEVRKNVSLSPLLIIRLSLTTTVLRLFALLNFSLFALSAKSAALTTQIYLMKWDNKKSFGSHLTFHSTQ